MMSVMKQASARRAEKALKEILDKADDNANGRVSGDIVLLLFLFRCCNSVSFYFFLLVKTSLIVGSAHQTIALFSENYLFARKAIKLKQLMFHCKVRLKDFVDILEANDVKVN